MRILAAAAVCLALTGPASADKAKKFPLAGQRLVVPSLVYFKAGTAELMATESAAALDHVTAYLKAKTNITLLRIEVHTDSTGGDGFNQRITEARALAVAAALVTRGIECGRVLPVGFGETHPIASNKTADGRARNRRTDFVNAAINGRAIDDAPVDGGGTVAGDPCSSSIATP